MGWEYLSQSGSVVHPPDQQKTEKIEAEDFRKIVNALKNVLSHTHSFYDNYGSNCNCNCNCTRGIL